ncbi:MAG: class I SAM-dependent methyltransferase [Desulfobacteraceae bacterium]|nr:class I SAM-dependent methyltransferase [Desulfobacteraceae bacterium]
MINPHFDHGRVVWDDRYSGQYKPVDYGLQFDDQWRLFLKKQAGFHNHTGVETDDEWIDDRIAELTGVEGLLANKRKFNNQRRSVGGVLQLDPKYPINFFKGRRCLDIGCGAGRWTKALQILGGDVKSVDTSEHGLESVRRFNDDVERLDLFKILAKRADLHQTFDFTLCWGVIMCTHDPKRAFENVAATVNPKGHLYVMVYAPTYHASDRVLEWRKYYHCELKTFEDRLKFAYSISEDPKNAINYLDMLNTYYNWVIPEKTIHNWFLSAGFSEVITLNRNEKHNCAWHVRGIKE